MRLLHITLLYNFNNIKSTYLRFILNFYEKFEKIKKFTKTRIDFCADPYYNIV